MPTAHDVPADLLIRRLAEQLRRVPQIAPPPWTPFVKTGSQAERPPQDREWWYARCASLLRKVYIHGPVGLSDLESEYGARKRVRFNPAHHRDAGGGAIRKGLQQLEAAGLVTKVQGKGRMLTSRGASLLDRLSGEIFKELVNKTPALARYA